MYRVYYTDSFASGRYGVYRGYDTEAQAREFINNNALVFPLPNCRLTKVTGYFPFTEIDLPVYA